MPATRRSHRRGTKSRSRKRSALGRRRHRKATSRVSARGRISDIHHFKETIDGGTIIIPSGTTQGTTVNKGGVWAFRLGDFPAYASLSANFEFARLNSITIDFIPKFNMQLNGTAAAAGTHSVTGTFITALDQIPLVTFQATMTNAEIYTPDPTQGTPTQALCWRNDQVTCQYVRGLQGSRERELYKRHTFTFKPAFYTFLLDTPITNGGALGANASNSGCFERQIMKWVNINILEQGASAGADQIVTNVGPTYYGPLCALDIDDSPETGEGGLALFDVRLTYSMSFKRLKGQVGTT